jgi:phenol/toluene 2-monooxygenase (NADH) P5/A5
MSYDLTIEPLGVTIEVEDGQSILDASLRAGIYLPHACGHGLCATCKVQLVDGEVDHGEASTFALMDFEREEGKTLACCAIPQSDVTIEAEIDEEPDALNIAVSDFRATVTRIEDVTPTIKAVVLELAEDLQFQPGQYVNLHIPENEALTRPFSLANPPQTGRQVELNIRLVPGGAATTYVHEALKTGDHVRLSGPYGRFFVRASRDTPLLFMAGGSGLSSPRSMILDLLAQGHSSPITLVYGARNRAELYYHAEFEALAAQHAHFTYVPALSEEPSDSDWQGARGFAHEAAIAHYDNDFRGNTAYLCGPPMMIEASITALIQGRLFERDIFIEKFISAADAQQVRSPFFKKF